MTARKATRQREPDPLPPMAEGVRQELEMRGWAYDPFTGGVFRRDEQGRISYTGRK